MGERHDRLRRARIDAGFKSGVEAAARFGWNRNTYKSNENGNAPFSYAQAEAYAKAYRVRPDWLYAGRGPMRDGSPGGVRIIGVVGADPSGEVIRTVANESYDTAPLPPGGSEDSVAVEVVGHSMRGVADDGALIYFEVQHTPPTSDMLGQVLVVETEAGHVLLKRLLRGSSRNTYDLESLNGPTLQDQRIVWAAHITAIVPPHQARRIIKRAAEAA